MIRTYGLTHVGLSVRDLDRSYRFYHQLFGVRATYRDGTSLQVETPGSHDVIVFEADASSAGLRGGVSHVGFRLRNPEDIEAAVEAATRAGGKILERGEFVPGEPYVFVADPDGYRVEIWFESSTRVRGRKGRRAKVRRRPRRPVGPRAQQK